MLTTSLKGPLTGRRRGGFSMIELVVAMSLLLISMIELSLVFLHISRQIRENQRPVVITERGKPAAVIVDLEEYERQKEKMELMEAVLEGEKDFQEGYSKSLDQLHRETRQWLAKK